MLAFRRENESTRMAMEQLRVEILLKSPNLPADGGLAQMQALTRMGEAAGLRNRMKYAQFVPIHRSISQSSPGSPLY